MAIIIGKHTKVIVQGITGRQGSFHTAQMLEYGTEIVGGVSPGKGGQYIAGVPVYNTVVEAQAYQRADASIIFIPAPGVKDATLEAMDGGIRTIVIITEHVPLHDALQIMAIAKQRDVTIIGPNTFGIITPGQSKVGIMPNNIYQSGPVGIVARSGTLSYEIVFNLTNAGIGQSTVIGLGGDRVVGLSFLDVLKLLEADTDTKAVVLVGEIGGNAEEQAAEYIKTMSKPVVSFIAGSSAPPGKKMGHAGAIIERGRGTYRSKVEALRSVGCVVAKFPWDVPSLIKKMI